MGGGVVGGCLAVRPPGCHAARLRPGPAPSQHKIYDPGVRDARFESGTAKVDAEPMKVMRSLSDRTSFEAQPTSFATPVSNPVSQTWSSQNLPWGRGGGNVVFHINGRQNRDGELLFHQPGAEIRSRSFPYSDLSWGPHKGIRNGNKNIPQCL